MFYEYKFAYKNYYFVFGKESTGIPTEILKPYLDNEKTQDNWGNFEELYFVQKLDIETGEEFESIVECSRVMGIGVNSISRCVNRRSFQTSEGFHFEPIE